MHENKQHVWFRKYCKYVFTVHRMNGIKPHRTHQDFCWGMWHMTGKISLSLKFDCFPLASVLWFRFKDIQTNQSLCKEGVCLILDKMTERKKSEWHLILLRQRNFCTHGELGYKENLAVHHINIQLTYLHMHTHVHEKSCFCFVKTLFLLRHLSTLILFRDTLIHTNKQLRSISNTGHSLPCP